MNVVKEIAIHLVFLRHILYYRIDSGSRYNSFFFSSKISRWRWSLNSILNKKGGRVNKVEIEVEMCPFAISNFCFFVKYIKYIKPFLLHLKSFNHIFFLTRILSSTSRLHTVLAFFPCPLDLILEEPSFDPCYPIRAVRDLTTLYRKAILENQCE